MKYRMTICLASLVSGLVAVYLHLWKIGRVGALSCGMGGDCELVQHSSWSFVLGVDVALIGALGYGLLFAVSLVSLQPKYVDARGPTLLMAAMIGAAVLFTLRLKYAEFVILRSFCPWCSVSAVAIALCAVIIGLDWRRVRTRPHSLVDGREQDRASVASSTSANRVRRVSPGTPPRS